MRGSGRRVWCRALRHSFATLLPQDGCDIRTIRKLLAHKDDGKTMNYRHDLNPRGPGVITPLEGSDGRTHVASARVCIGARPPTPLAHVYPIRRAALRGVSLRGTRGVPADLEPFVSDAKIKAGGSPGYPVLLHPAIHFSQVLYTYSYTDESIG